MSEIIIAVIGLLGVLGSAWIGYLATRRQKRKKDQAENEMTLQRAALDFSGFLSEWSGVYEALEALMEETEIDRFLILRAWNGTLTPKWTTAIYQMRKGDQEPIQYIHFELDADYVERLNKIIHRGHMLIDVAEIDQSAIKRIYEAEGVTASLWSHLETLDDSTGANRAVTYCSFATHSEAKIPDSTVTKCRILTGRLKGVAQSLTKPS